MEYSKLIRSRLDPYREFGVEKLDDGTELIGKAKFIAPFAYLHSLYAPLNEAEILLVQEKLAVTFPRTVIDFFLCFNGLTLFVNTFEIYGLRKSNSRLVDSSRQPFDIFAPNISGRIADAESTMLFIGGYGWNRSKLYMDLKTGEVFLCSRISVAPLLKWSSFYEMIDSELDRLISSHTKDGKNIPFKPTVPVGGEDMLISLIEAAKTSKEPPYWYEEMLRTGNLDKYK